jgi:hypothetical protein
MSKGNVAARREGGAKFTTGWRNSGWREAMARVAAAARENMPRAKKVEKITKEPNGTDSQLHVFICFTAQLPPPHRAPPPKASDTLGIRPAAATVSHTCRRHGQSLQFSS